MVTITLQFVRIISDVVVRTGTDFIMFLLNIFALFNSKVRFCSNGNSLFYLQPHNNIKCYYDILYTNYHHYIYIPVYYNNIDKHLSLW